MKHLFASALLAAAIPVAAQNSPTNAVIRADPLAGGRIEPTLFGNFMELLDDVVPGTWAELLNDRSFAGVIPSGRLGLLRRLPGYLRPPVGHQYHLELRRRPSLQWQALRQTHRRLRPGQPHPIGPLGAERHGIQLFGLYAG